MPANKALALLESESSAHRNRDEKTPSTWTLNSTFAFGVVEITGSLRLNILKMSHKSQNEVCHCTSPVSVQLRQEWRLRRLRTTAIEYFLLFSEERVREGTNCPKAKGG